MSETLPDLLLKPSRPRGFGYLVMCAAFAAFGAAMGSSGIGAGWYVAAVFGVGVLVFLTMLLPGSSFLRLDSKGFVIRSLYRQTRYSWADVAEFGVAAVGVRRMVVFNFAPGYARERRGRRLSRGLSGWEAALPDSYGVKLARLAAVMNEYRKRYGSQA